MDLDPVNFTDESFPSFATVKPSEAAEGVTGGKEKKRNAEVMTDELYYLEAETNTKFKKNAVSVSNHSFINL